MQACTEIIRQSKFARAKMTCNSSGIRGLAGLVPIEARPCNTDRYTDILGGGTSAKEVAESLGRVSALETSAMNGKAGVANIAYHLQPEVELYEVLHAATLRVQPKNKGFTSLFVDLTGKAVRPGWMSEDSLGGSDDSMGMSLDLQGSITAVARGIEKMRKPMNLFRSMAHFVLCFLRAAVVAIRSVADFRLLTFYDPSQLMKTEATANFTSAHIWRPSRAS